MPSLFVLWLALIPASATTLGLHNHRSSRRPYARIPLPDGVRTLPELMREAGYYTFNFAHDRKQMFDNGGGPGP